MQMLIALLFFLGSLLLPGFRGNMIGFALIFLPIPLAGLFFKYSRLDAMRMAGVYRFSIRDLLKMTLSSAAIFTSLFWIASALQAGAYQLLTYFLFLMAVYLFWLVLSLLVNKEKSTVVTYLLLVSDMVFSIVSDYPGVIAGDLLFKEPNGSSILKFTWILLIECFVLFYALKETSKEDYL